MNYIIIGNSAAGISAIEAIREYDKRRKITVISDEPYFNYSRPLISYLLGKRVNQESLSFRSKEFYQDNNVDLVLNKTVTGLDLEKKNVLVNRQKMHFDKLLIATGGISIIPEIQGIDLDGIFTFTKLANAQTIGKYIRDNKVKRTVIIGGGLIGLKATEALLELGIKVTIVELAGRILSATFDKKASSIIESALKKIGCTLITNDTVNKLQSKNKKVNGIILKSKKKLATDMVIISIGVRPNIGLVKNTPIRTNKGILVNSYMQTNIKDVYAAGDCCETKEKSELIAIWPVAVRQGKIAGYNIAGVKKQYSGGLIMNSVELCGIPTISVGQTNTEGRGYQIIDYYDQEKSVYKKIILKQDRIIGAICVGDIERAGIYTGLIKDMVDTRTFKEYLLREDFGLISLPEEYRKHLVTEKAVII